MKKIFLIFALAFNIFGCANMNGGMPNVPFDAESDLGIATSELKAQSSIKIYYDSPTLSNRNRFVATRLVLINISYINFIKAMSAEESQLHSAADILVVSLDIAASAASPVNAKTIMSGISSIVGGSRLALDKNTFHDKTMSALIASMNAQRKEIFVRILRGTSSGLEAYSIEQALADLSDYYLAGTVPGALNAIQRDAGSKEVQADKRISDLTVTRDAMFVNPVTQKRVDNLLDALKKVPVTGLLALSNAPPVTDPFIEKTVLAMYPSALHKTNSVDAESSLRVRIVMGQRSEQSLEAWEAAVKAMQL